LLTLLLLLRAGDLSVVLIHGDDGKPSTPQYTLFTPNGTRYSLASLPGTQWVTGMQIRVTGVKTVGFQKTAVGPTSASVAVQNVVVVSTPPLLKSVSGTTAQALVGSSPSTMAVLYIIVTMCTQTASITPSVSWAVSFRFMIVSCWS
jgi:hypothetical protein